MASLLGIFVVFAAVLGGFAMGGGAFSVLIQPNELIVIGGAAIGSVLSSAPGKARSRMMQALKRSFQDGSPSKQDYLDL